MTEYKQRWTKILASWINSSNLYFEWSDHKMKLEIQIEKPSLFSFDLSKPKVMCLHGSMNAWDEFLKENSDFTKKMNPGQCLWVGSESQMLKLGPAELEKNVLMIKARRPRLAWNNICIVNWSSKFKTQQKKQNLQRASSLTELRLFKKRAYLSNDSQRCGLHRSEVEQTDRAHLGHPGWPQPEEDTQLSEATR